MEEDPMQLSRLHGVHFEKFAWNGELFDPPKLRQERRGAGPAEV